ncbi:MAG: class I SAM-dependent methyltransferase [Candidatus Obscuribacterales bacterium]|nr:class I SAM-dependent methyltransferase [Candidatus Obscuribacterales bacterium]
MTTLKTQTTTPPARITGLLQSGWANQVLRTAVELDIFSHLNDKPLTSKDLAAKAGLDAKATGYLLNALVSLEYLTQQNNIYALTEVSQFYLVKGSPLYFGNHVLADDIVNSAWHNLTDKIKDGRSCEKVNNDSEAVKFFPDLAANIFPINYTTAQAVVKVLKAESLSEPFRVLDIAAGSAVWSIPFAEANKRATVDALDFPEVLVVTKRFAEQHGVANQFNYLSGNWRDIKIEQQAYDFVALGHILHCEGKELSQRLLAEAYAALKPGGTVIVAEFISNDQLSGPVFPMLFALNMFLLTENGCVFSQTELKSMFEEAGFKEVERLTLPFWNQESPVMVAKKI